MRCKPFIAAFGVFVFAAGALAAGPVQQKVKPKTVEKPAPATQVDTSSGVEKTRIDALIQYQHDLVSVLALRADAVHLLGAALLARPLRDQPKELTFHRLAERAARAPAAGPGVTWARLADCDPEPGACPNADMLALLRKQAPGNAAVWMLGMDDAVAKNDADAEHAALAKAAAAQGYDDYFGISLQALASSVGTLPPLPETMTGKQPGEPTSAAGVELLIAYGVANRHPQPDLKPLLQLCTPDNVTSHHDLKSDCLKIAHTLEWGSSPLARAVGLHIHGELDPTAKPGTERDTRNLAWQVQNYNALSARAVNDDKLARQLLDAARKGGTELSLVLSSLRANDVAVEAPADWQPTPASPASTTGG